MRTLRIVLFGLLGVTAVLTFVTIHLWREEAQRKEGLKGLKVLRELTPERLIANCGQPFSDTEPVILDMKAGTATVNVTGASVKSADGVAIARRIEYRGPQISHWVKFQFIRDIDNQLQPTRWHLIHFESTRGGVGPLDEDAYVEISVFPCMAKRTP
jgi:hypothetical protein